MMNTLISLKLWQKVIVVAVVCAVAGGVYGIYSWVSGPSTTSAQDNIQLVQVQYGDLENTVSASGSLVFPNEEQLTFGSAGTLQEVNVQEGDTVEAGQVLAKLDDASTIELQKAILQARIDLGNAELRAIETEATLADARVALRTAQEALEAAENPYSEADIVKAELAVVNAEIALANAEESYEKAKAQYEVNPSVYDWIRDYEQKRLQLASAELELTAAEENLAEMLAGPDPLEVEQKQKQLKVAQANLQQAEENLEGELRQLELAEAQAALDEATEKLEMATMVAPFGGVVTAVNVKTGETVTANQTVIKVQDTSTVEVSAILDEIDVSQVERGQAVSIYLDALPDLELTGEVSYIATSAQTQSGVVTYPVTIRVDVPSGVQLREGMSATASIVVESAVNVLIVPTQAISGTTSNPVVSVMVDDEVQQREVTLGISDGSWTEVTGGLQETDLVVLTYSASSSTTTSTSSQSMPGGGVIPGGGTVFFR
jgi:HlyD family secretion protein